MAIDKPKLTPESKRTLLEQSLQWFKPHKLNRYSSDENVPAFFSFTKLILINQSFLGTSRTDSFGIYELYLDYFRVWKCESDYLCFKSKHVGFLKGAKISFERDCKLVKLLQPPKIGLKFGFGSDKIEQKNLKELIEIVKVTTGEISIEVMNTIAPFYDVVREFSSRIRNFSCMGRFFTYCGMSSFGFLNELEVNDILNADQFLHVSTCKAKSLNLSFCEVEFYSPHSFDFSMLTNNKHFLNKTVKQLRLSVYLFDYVMTQRIIEQVLKFFPSLIEIEIDACPLFNEHPKSQIPNVASNSYQYMRALKDRLFANGLKKVSLKFQHRLFYKGKCTHKWIEKAYNTTEFKDWECKLKYRWPSNHYDFDFRDVILKFNTEEGNCKFDVRLEVSHDTGIPEENDGDSTGSDDDSTESDGDLTEHEGN